MLQKRLPKGTSVQVSLAKMIEHVTLNDLVTFQADGPNESPTEND